MRFLVDAQLPPALARRLTEHGQAAEHVSDQGMAADDLVIWEDARATRAVIVTKDEGFAARRTLATDRPAAVRIHVGNTRRRELLAWFAVRLPTVLEALERGESLIEIV